VTGDVQNTRLFVDGVLLQGVNMILTLAAYAFFMWRIQPALTLACLSVSLPLWWLAHYYSARLRPGYLRNRELTDNMVLLFSESVRGMQTVKGFAAEAHQVRRFEGGQRQGVVAAAENFLGPVRLHARHANALAIEPGDFVRLRRLAVCAGEIPLGSGLVVFAGLLQQFTGQVANFDHRQFRAAKPGGGAARV
jgi:ATP-binding cassette, subfamily B, bacterial